MSVAHWVDTQTLLVSLSVSLVKLERKRMSLRELLLAPIAIQEATPQKRTAASVFLVLLVEQLNFLALRNAQHACFRLILILLVFSTANTAPQASMQGESVSTLSRATTAQKIWSVRERTIPLAKLATGSPLCQNQATFRRTLALQTCVPETTIAQMGERTIQSTLFAESVWMVTQNGVVLA